MKKYPQLAVVLSASIGYAALVYVGYFRAQAPTPNCLMQKVDALDEKALALEHVVEHLTAQVSNSVKSGQAITLHTQTARGGGCLTYIGPSGDLGGLVSWNANCFQGTLWTIN